MSNDRIRRPMSARDRADALFKPAPPKPAAPAERRPLVPGTREMVTLRIDAAVLAHFQAGGPGWQDRINDALRQIVGPPADGSIAPDDLNAQNDG